MELAVGEITVLKGLSLSKGNKQVNTQSQFSMNSAMVEEAYRTLEWECSIRVMIQGRPTKETIKLRP